MVDHWTGGGTVPRDEDGHIIWCDAPGPMSRNGTHRVHCVRVLFHDGDFHENGTFRWPRGEDE